MVILICGFMGAGKTTFLSQLEKNSSEKNLYLDLDQVLVEKHSGQFENLSQLIGHFGWEQFRELEFETLVNLVELNGEKSDRDLIVALGGGSLNIPLLSLIKKDQAIFLVWLKTSFNICLERIEGDQLRPLAKKGANGLEKLYLEREKLYRKADYCLTASDQGMVWTVKKLKESLCI